MKLSKLFFMHFMAIGLFASCVTTTAIVPYDDGYYVFTQRDGFERSDKADFCKVNSNKVANCERKRIIYKSPVPGLMPDTISD